VTLCLAPDFDTHGSFQGAVIVGAAEKPDGEQILKGIQISSGIMKLAGFLIVLAGVAVAWTSKVWARSRLDRDSALQPVALLRQNLEALSERLAALRDGLGSNTENTAATIKRLQEDIADQTLAAKHLLPPVFPNPFGATFDLAALKAALDKASADQQAVSVLVRSIETVAAMDETKVPGGHASVEGAIAGLDRIATSAVLPTPDAAQVQADKIIEGLRPAAAQSASVQITAQPAGGRQEEPDRLQIDIERVSGFVWLIWALLTALSALAVLILSNPGFGTPTDLLYCFFWGFGLPTVGQQLTPSSAGTSLGISIGKPA